MSQHLLTNVYSTVIYTCQNFVLAKISEGLWVMNFGISIVCNVTHLIKKKYNSKFQQLRDRGTITTLLNKLF